MTAHRDIMLDAEVNDTGRAVQRNLDVVIGRTVPNEGIPRLQLVFTCHRVKVLHDDVSDRIVAQCAVRHTCADAEVVCVHILQADFCCIGLNLRICVIRCFADDLELIEAEVIIGVSRQCQRQVHRICRCLVLGAEFLPLARLAVGLRDDCGSGGIILIPPCEL